MIDPHSCSQLLLDITSLGGSKDVCYDGTYRDKTLQLAYELPFSALFKDTKGQKKYEASSVIMVSKQHGIDMVSTLLTRMMSISPKDHLLNSLCVT
jgi:hypothetical protein